MMAGQARQIALRKLEVAVLSHGTFQAQRNGFCALLSDVLACYLSFTHVVGTVTATCGASSGGRTRVSALEGRSISRYTIPA